MSGTEFFFRIMKVCSIYLPHNLICMNVRLILFMLSSAWSSISIGQQLYAAELEIEGVKGSKLITLSGGDLMMVSSRNGNLHLSSWNGSGDTLWTREHQVAFNANGFFPNSMFQLATGEIIVSSDPVALLNENGDLLDTLDMLNGHLVELGTDSILGIGYDTMELRSIMGDLIWETPLVQTNCHMYFAHVVSATSNGVAVYSAGMGDVPGEFFSFGHIYLSRYGNDGSFIDTTLLSLSMSVSPGVYASTNTADGGTLFLGQVGSGDVHLVRSDNFGDTLWTRRYGYGQEIPWVGRSLRTVTELSDGRILLSGSSHEMDPTEWTAMIMELDAFGEILCVEHLSAPTIEDFYAFRSDLAILPDGSIHALMTDLESEWPWTTLYGYNELCFTTGVMDNSSTAGFNAFTTSDQLIIEIDIYHTDHTYALYNSFGQLIMKDGIRSARTSIPTDRFSSGIYVLSIVHTRTGERQAAKVFIH